MFYRFFLPQQNVFIEYNGEQHYHPIEHFGGVAIFEEQIKRDKSVREYSNINNSSVSINQNISKTDVSFPQNIKCFI